MCNILKALENRSKSTGNSKMSEHRIAKNINGPENPLDKQAGRIALKRPASV